MVTQRRFGPTRSLAAPSVATLKVAASGAAHERLSPTGGRAGWDVRMGQECAFNAYRNATSLEKAPLRLPLAASCQLPQLGSEIVFLYTAEPASNGY